MCCNAESSENVCTVEISALFYYSGVEIYLSQPYVDMMRVCPHAQGENVRLELGYKGDNFINPIRNP